MEKVKKSRRRGEELMDDLFEAAFKLVNEFGPTNFNYQQLADAAGTSRSVLYRRWPTTLELLQDVYTHKARKLFEGDFFGELKDNGSLRADLIELLTIYQRIQTDIGITVINNYYAIRQLDGAKDKVPAVHFTAREKHLQAMRKLLERASKRGEKIREVDDLTLMLPYDLIRIENLVRADHFDTRRLQTIVDQVLVPAFLQS